MEGDDPLLAGYPFLLFVPTCQFPSEGLACWPRPRQDCRRRILRHLPHDPRDGTLQPSEAHVVAGDDHESPRVCLCLSHLTLV